MEMTPGKARQGKARWESDESKSRSSVLFCSVPLCYFLYFFVYSGSHSVIHFAALAWSFFGGGVVFFFFFIPVLTFCVSDPADGFVRCLQSYLVFLVCVWVCVCVCVLHVYVLGVSVFAFGTSCDDNEWEMMTL